MRPRADVVQDGRTGYADPWRGLYSTLGGKVVRNYTAQEVRAGRLCERGGFKVLQALHRWRDTVNEGAGAQRERALREAGR